MSHPPRVFEPEGGTAGRLGSIADRYGLEVDRESIPRLTEEYGLTFGPPASAAEAADDVAQ